ncbi:MAG TPA: DUF488 domain-containing protein [Ignavibacteria bacterium]|nr:DUF488 domain-containing protein [Ignavibacteria bacterium]
MIKIKRIYEKSSNSDGYRILVDRLWPRGLTKEKANIDIWLKEIAPTTGLRKWFAHDPKKWKSFKEKYKRELKNNSDLISKIKQLEKDEGVITLLYAAKDEKYNEAVVLKSIFH